MPRLSTDSDDPGSDVELEQDRGRAKRARHTAPAEYPKGTVKQLKVFNFMTYGEPAVTITPGPRLNLVLGPNGTGKSSLVCALCVGLGGSTKLLGRADNVRDYIRRGADSGWVETTLSGGPGRSDHIIRCELVKSGDSYTTNWKINRVSRSKKEVQELVKSLNIQFDNLCQFLPQDKVVEFARLDHHELLVATEKAIGDASLYETHQKLIQQRDAIKEHNLLLVAEQQRLEQLTAENARMEREYQRFKKKKMITDKIAVMRKKVAWMDVKEAQDKTREMRVAKEDAEKALKQAQREAKADEAPANGDAHWQWVDSVDDLRTRLAGLAEARERQVAEIEKLTAKLQKSQSQLDTLPPAPDHSAEQRQLTDEMQGVRDQLFTLETEKAQLDQDITNAKVEENRVAAQLRQCDDARYQRLRALMSSRKGMQGLADAARWVDQQRQAGVFQGPVLGPLGADIRMLDNSCANYLEQACFFSLCDFACTNQQDADRLAAEFKRQGVRSNVVAVITDLNAPIPNHSAQLSSFGVRCSLDEVYDAPPLVKHCLAQLHNLNQVYVMQEHDLSAVKRLMNQHNVGRVFTPQMVVSYIASAYGGKEDGALQTAGLFPGKVLAATGAGADLDEEVADLAKRKSSLQRAIKNGQDHLAKLQAKKDPMAEAPALQKHLTKALTAHHAALTQQLDAAHAQWDLLQQHAAAEMVWRELDMQACAMAAAIEDAKATAEAEHPLDDETRDKFGMMPDTRAREAQIKQATEQVATIQRKLGNVAEEVDQLKVTGSARVQGYMGSRVQGSGLEAAGDQLLDSIESWLPELERVVGLINESFSTNFAQIGCAGEVLLGQHEDYDQFSIQIKVKFREHEDLQLLTGHRQSGGERSVSTILFLIALQINQGMDPINERKVFNQLVEAACQEGTPQCFLLTPKLLPDLPFTQDITVLNIFNGAMIDQAVAGNYSRSVLFGSKNLAAMGQQRSVSVAG
eukprot:gene10125-10283_t